MHPRQFLEHKWDHVQSFLLPIFEEQLGPLTKLHERFITVIDTIDIAQHIKDYYKIPGRPQKDRCSLFRAFIAKTLMNLPTTKALIERLHVDIKLCRLCGWETTWFIPSESTFSRAFAEFSESRVVELIHEQLIETTYEDRLIGHISRDSTAIEAREKTERQPIKPEKNTEKRGRGRPRKGEIIPPKEPSRIERQMTMSLEQMLMDLPMKCGKGAKKDSKGNTHYWEGYKMHIDTADGDVPISFLLTSASVHDSQVSIPLMMMTSQKVTYLYELQDAAYHVEQIMEKSRQLGHVPIIDPKPKRGQKESLEKELVARRQAGYSTAEEIRYKERSVAERVNSNLKDNYGGRHIRVRGNAKVMCHLGFGLLAMTVEQLMRLVT